MGYYSGGRLHGECGCDDVNRGMGRAAGSAFLGQLPNTTITIGPDGQWEFPLKARPPSKVFWDEMVQWGGEETIWPGAPNALVAGAAILAALIWMRTKH